MARRGAKKLERIAGTLDVIAHLDAPLVLSSVDVLPLLEKALAVVRASERQKALTVEVPVGASVRVRVAPAVFCHALEEILGWCARRAQARVGVRVDEGGSLTFSADGIAAIPASEVPFDDALGVARHLLQAQGATLDSETDGSSLSITVTAQRASNGAGPAGPSVAGAAPAGAPAKEEP
jgi:hypothetical protein